MKGYTATDTTKSAIESLSEIRNESTALARKNGKVQFTGTRKIGLAMMGAGGAALGASYFTSSVVMMLSGLGLIFWGLIMLYITPQRYVPERIFGSLAVSNTKSIDRLLVSLNCNGRTIFLHPKHLKGLSQGYVFVPHELREESALPSDEALAEEKLVYEDPRGIFMVAPSNGLVELIESEMDLNLAIVDLSYIRDVIPKFIVNTLRMVDSMTVQEEHGSVRVVMEGESAARVCQTISRETSIGAHFGCPLCSSIALMISKVTGKPVLIEETKVDEVNSTISSTYRTVES